MKLFPIGTVVSLKSNVDFPLLIIGKMPIIRSENRRIEYFDYKALAYPIGDIGEDEYFCFNEEDIESVIYNGMQSDDNIKYDVIIHNLKEMKDAKKISNSTTLGKLHFSNIKKTIKEKQTQSSTNRLSN